MPARLKKYLLLITIVIAVSANAQIVAPTADYVDTASYRIEDKNDTIFFFNIDSDNRYLEAIPADTGAWAYEWSEYLHPAGYQVLSSQTSDILNIPFVENDTTTKGYRLVLSKGAVSDTLRCWVIINHFDVEINRKDERGWLERINYQSCLKIGPIQTTIHEPDMWYYNPETKDTFNYSMGYKAEWKRQIEVTDTGTVREGYNGYFIDEMYWKSMDYYFIVTDSAGLEHSDTAYVYSIRPIAKLEKTHITYDNEEFYPDYVEHYHNNGLYDSEEGYSAPALFSFNSVSKNANYFEWDFGDSTQLKLNNDTSIYHEYTTWNARFKVSFTAKHINNDIDSLRYWSDVCESNPLEETIIKIKQPSLNAPNFFSIGNNSIPYWHFEDFSMREIEINIYARTGRRVHHFEGNFYEWPGWDGTVNNTSNFVGTGVYYYVVHSFTQYKSFLEEDRNPEVNAFGGASGGGNAGTGNTNTGDPQNTTKKSGGILDAFGIGGGDAGKPDPNKDNPNNNKYRGYIHVFNNN